MDEKIDTSEIQEIDVENENSSQRFIYFDNRVNFFLT